MILSEGKKPMGRKYVHLSEGVGFASWFQLFDFFHISV
ncbi:hypothetical protein P4H66_17845 [Paenibacillus dokdonensis]|uniref:Uncharacterized protein n=1 Tax=Paenibacillus dokdonensis TaxID=2567944 RepID=A0ABU6GPM3_9BACL|nr:hypothetical protein [Paenibacillus dokdonensis]MEC0241682.1 hypothetical protein [Paenibacillus dokdonensis]